MRKHLEKDPSLQKASFYVPKGALQNSSNKMVPVLVRRAKDARQEEELSTGDDGSFEASAANKVKETKSKAIYRPSTQVSFGKNSLKKFAPATTEVLDMHT